LHLYSQIADFFLLYRLSMLILRKQSLQLELVTSGTKRGTT